MYEDDKEDEERQKNWWKGPSWMTDAKIMDQNVRISNYGTIIPKEKKE